VAVAAGWEEVEVEVGSWGWEASDMVTDRELRASDVVQAGKGRPRTEP
jgi:phage-related minor tail protein